MGDGVVFLIIGVIIALFVIWQLSVSAKAKAYGDALGQIIESERPNWEAGVETAKEEKKEKVLHTLGETLTHSPFDFFSNYYQLLPSAYTNLRGSFNYSISANTSVPFAAGYSLPFNWRLKDGKLVYEESFKVNPKDFDPSIDKHFKQHFLRSIKELAKGSSIYDVFLDAGLRREDFIGGRNYVYYKHGPVDWLVNHTTFSKSTFGRLSNKRMSSRTGEKRKHDRQVDFASTTQTFTYTPPLPKRRKTKRGKYRESKCRYRFCQKGIANAAVREKKSCLRPCDTGKQT